MWPRVSGRAAWKEARETQATYGSPEGTWGPASSEVAARAHGVTYGHHIGVGGGPGIWRRGPGGGRDLIEAGVSLTSRQSGSPGPQAPGMGKTPRIPATLRRKTPEKGTVEKP